MNLQTTIFISFQQYYFFLSECGSVPSKDEVPVALLLGKSLLLLAKKHPTALTDISFFKRLKLKVSNRSGVPMVLGREIVTALMAITQVKEKEVSLVSRVLLTEFSTWDVSSRTRFLSQL